MIFSPVENRLTLKVYIENSPVLLRVVIQGTVRGGTCWSHDVFMAGNAPGSHINPPLFHLFYAGLLVVGMFSE